MPAARPPVSRTRQVKADGLTRLLFLSDGLSALGLPTRSLAVARSPTPSIGERQLGCEPGRGPFQMDSIGRRCGCGRSIRTSDTR